MLWQLPDATPDNAERAYGTVIGHVAKANPQWQGFHDTPVQLIFHGAHAYVSPGYYSSVVNVPTWNYTAVHMQGRVEVVSELPEQVALLTALTDFHEQSQVLPWTLDATHPKLAPLFNAIVCFRVHVSEVSGQFKMNQNKSLADQRSVATHLQSSAHAHERDIALLMKQHLKE